MVWCGVVDAQATKAHDAITRGSTLGRRESPGMDECCTYYTYCTLHHLLTNAHERLFRSLLYSALTLMTCASVLASQLSMR